MNRFGVEKIASAIDGNEVSKIYNINGMGKSQIFGIVTAGTTGTIKVQISPNSVDWFTPSDAVFTLVGTETGDALKLLYAIQTASPYVRVICETVAVGTVDARIAFTENN